MSQVYAVNRGEIDVEREPSASILSRLLAETFGSFVLVLGLVGTSLYSILNQGSALPSALAGGLAWIAASAAVGRVSGGHFNPAVSFGSALAGRLPWRDLGPYVLAQLVGAVLAASVLFATIPRTLLELIQKEDNAAFFSGAANGFAKNSPLFTLTGGGGQGPAAQFELVATLLVEIIVTAVFVGVFLGVTDRRSRVFYAPVVTGLLVTALTLLTWFVDGGSFNPARSTAAALFSNEWTVHGVGGQLWLFWVGPLIGAALAALFYRAFAAEYDEYEELETEADGDDDWSDPATEEATVVTTEPAEATVVTTEPAEAADATEADKKKA